MSFLSLAVCPLQNNLLTGLLVPWFSKDIGKKKSGADTIRSIIKIYEDIQTFANSFSGEDGEYYLL